MKKMILPLFLLGVIIAVMILIGLFNVPGAATAKHLLTILLIAAIGWFLYGFFTKLYHRFLQQIGDREQASPSQRSLLTQVHLLYNLTIFAIVLVAVALILMTFPYIKNVGLGILGSAGIAGIALGIAARPILLNMMAGFQIAMTKTVKIGDLLVIDGETGRVESIQLTHIVFLTWDLRKFIVPISRFIDQTFQNWDVANPEMIGSVFLYCDYRVPVEHLREHLKEILTQCSYWNRRVLKMHVTDCTAQAVEVRIIASANNSSDTFELKAYIREKLIQFLQKNYPDALPCLRIQAKP